MERLRDRVEDYYRCVMVDWNMKTSSVLDGLAHGAASVGIELEHGTANIVEWWIGTWKLSM